MRRSVEWVLPERKAARRQFRRAAARFGQAAFVHDEARSRLVDRLNYLAIEPACIVDLGSGPGAALSTLSARYPAARVIALDSTPAMLGRTAARAAVCGDAERLPLRDASVDLLFANLLLPWCDPEVFFAECARVLASQGLLVFSTVGPDTLAEIRRAWASTGDQAVHVHGFVDMHDLGDVLMRSGLAEPVLDVDRIDVTYRDSRALIDDLRACGATNVAGGRRRSLTGRQRWTQAETALAGPNERFGVTVELILGQAWKGQNRTSERAEAIVPLSSIGRPPSKG
jgi:malonyl-CoA O-methyltransferase